MKKVRVLLLKEAPGLGKKGEVKEVNRGYAENFLIPRGLARLVNEEVENILQTKILKEKAQREKKRKEAEEIKEKIERNVLVVKVKAGKEGKIFGSVTAKSLTEALLRQLGVKIDKKEIELEETIKKLGNYSYFVKLYGGLRATGRLVVEEDG